MDAAHKNSIYISDPESFSFLNNKTKWSSSPHGSGNIRDSKEEDGTCQVLPVLKSTPLIFCVATCPSPQILQSCSLTYIFLLPFAYPFLSSCCHTAPWQEIPNFAKTHTSVSRKGMQMKNKQICMHLVDWHYFWEQKLNFLAAHNEQPFLQILTNNHCHKL